MEKIVLKNNTEKYYSLLADEHSDLHVCRLLRVCAPISILFHLLCTLTLSQRVLAAAPLLAHRSRCRFSFLIFSPPNYRLFNSFKFTRSFRTGIYAFFRTHFVRLQSTNSPCVPSINHMNALNLLRSELILLFRYIHGDIERFGTYCQCWNRVLQVIAYLLQQLFRI